MDLPKRKQLRLENYNYLDNGVYYITICTYNREHLFGEIVGANLCVRPNNPNKMVVKWLFEIEHKYQNTKIDKYVIMPTHIHVIIVLHDKSMDEMSLDLETAGASPRPTLTDIICTYKSLTTRICNKNDNILGRKIFQTSFYEKVIRTKEAYQEIWEYIDGNPLRWKEH